MFGIYRSIDISKHLYDDLESIQPQTIFFLCSDDRLMLALLEFALGYFRKWINHSLQNVFLLIVTVIIVEDLEDLVSVLRNLVKNIQDQVLMMVDRVSWVKNPQENLFKEDYYLLLQMLSKVFENTVKYWERKTENGLLIGHALLQEQFAESFLDHVDKLLRVSEDCSRRLDDS